MWTFLAIISVLAGGFIIWLWPSSTDEPDPFITVFQTGDPGKVAFIKSLFEEEEIPLSLQGEGVQDLFGMGRLGSGYNMITGPVQIKVPQSYREKALELLEALEDPQ